MRLSSLAILLALPLLSGCSFAKAAGSGVASKVAPSQTLSNHGSQQHSVLIFGFLERLAGDLDHNALVVASSAQDDEVASVSVGRQGYYAIFLPPGDYLLSVYVDRDDDGTIRGDELAGQSPEKISIREEGGHAHFGMDLEVGESPDSSLRQLMHVLEDSIPLDEGVPKMGASEEIFAPVYGKENIKRGMYESTTDFFSHVSPLQYLDEVDLTAGRKPIVFVHGINDSPQIFESFFAQISQAHYQPLFFYYPTGARLPSMAELLYFLFFSGQALPTAHDSLMVAHSMGGLVARGSLNHLSGVPGQSDVSFYGSLVSPYGGVAAAEIGIKTGPVIIPSWMDISPDSDFLGGLFAPLPKDTVFAMLNGNAEEQSDGVIRLSSQRREEAVEQARFTKILPETHVGIMSNKEAISTMLGWAEQAQRPHRAQLLADVERGATAPLLELEKARRVHLTRVGLIRAFKSRGMHALTSMVTPTVARLRVKNAKVSTVVQVSVGQGLRLDAPELDEPLYAVDWPGDELLSAAVDDITEVIQSRLASSQVPNTQSRIPPSLRLREGEKLRENGQVLSRGTPPPVVLSTGVAVSLTFDQAIAALQLPLKMDGYFGWFGAGMDLRMTLLQAFYQDALGQVAFDPYVLAGGPRLRFGRAQSPLSFALGLNGGVEVGRARLIEEGQPRLGYAPDKILASETLLNALLYASGTLGLRIHNDFYAVGVADFGARLPEKEFQITNQQSVYFSRSFFVTGLVGLEVRLP